MENTVTVKLDSNGLPYEALPEVAAELESLKKARQDAADALTAMTTERDTLQAKMDAAEKELEELKKVDNAAAIRDGVKARLDLETMSDDEIRIAIIKRTDKDFDPEGKSADYLAARFDAAKDILASMKKTDAGIQLVGGGAGSLPPPQVSPEQARMDALEKQKQFSLTGKRPE
jgi:hypothetical protein